MDTWIGVPPVALNTWSGHTRTGGNGRDDGSATSVRIDVILAAGEAGHCRTSSQNLNRVARIAARRVNGATAHGAAKARRRAAHDLHLLQKIDPSSTSLRNHKGTIRSAAHGRSPISTTAATRNRRRHERLLNVGLNQVREHTKDVSRWPSAAHDACEPILQTSDAAEDTVV